MNVVYGREALRRLRERQDRALHESGGQPSLLEQVPPDAPMDDATITAWNGERFAAYTAPGVRGEKPEQSGPAIPANEACVAGECGGARIWLVKDGERWLMYAGSRRAGARRRDFASPFLEHAIQTAEQWYGAPGGGWRAEKGPNEHSAEEHEAADLHSQGSTVAEGAGERGLDDLAVDGT